MSVIYTAILSLEQQIENKPVSYLTNIAGPLSSLQSELHWHMFDLSRFHQVIIDDLNKRNLDFDDRYKLFRENLKEQKSLASNDDVELLEYRASQTMSSFNGEGMVIDRCKLFADEFCVIGLWATAEKFLGKVYAHIDSHQSGVPLSAINVSYRWDDIKRKYANKSILIDDLDGYSDANECRVLNNAIKHVGFVNNRLAKFSFFSTRSGEELDKIEYEMQRYYNGVWSFLGGLIESGNRVLDTDFRY